jgi:cytochrome o ubiquinol oxidase operon protein cyoD
LTAIPFAVVAKHYMTPANSLLVIAITAVLQVLVHLRFFLHLRFTTSPRENLLAIVFTGVLLFLMLGGSFWIMFDLYRRMAI